VRHRHRTNLAHHPHRPGKHTGTQYHREHAAGARIGYLVSDAPRPRVDIGVVTWNTADTTVASLRRLLDVDQGCDLRVLVRDNASSDGTVRLLSERVPEADLEAGTENLGFAAGANTLLARSTAPWFFLLNPDAWPATRAIATLVATAETRPRAAAVVPRLENPDGSLQHSTHPFPSVGIASAILVGQRRLGRARAERLQLEGAWLHDKPRPVDWAIGAAMLLRREAIDDIGGFDERFFMYVEDLEWCWRAHRHGWEIFFEPGAVVTHIGNVAGEAAYGERRTATYMANTYRFYRREHGAISCALYRGVNVAGAALGYARARRTHDENLEHFWGVQLKAHLARARDVDQKPTRG
jgi:GT2 family glycosyltransferase